MKKLSTRKGFTLIELLIVIAIIGVLATIFFANYLGVRQRARDSQRKSNLRQIQAALELYRYDWGSYPDVLYSTNCPTSSSLMRGTVTYMQKIPCDPSSNSFYMYPPGNYFYSVSGAYSLIACIENTKDTDPNTGTVLATWCSSTKAFVLTSP